jgi:hypothetical protein
MDDRSSLRRGYAIALNRLRLLDPARCEQWEAQLMTRTGALDAEKMTPERLEQLRADLAVVVRERFAVLQAQWLDFEESNPEHEVVSDLRSYLVY